MTRATTQLPAVLYSNRLHRDTSTSGTYWLSTSRKSMQQVSTSGLINTDRLSMLRYGAHPEARTAPTGDQAHMRTSLL